MGELVSLAERRKARRPRPWRHGRPARAEFLFDLACPFTYLASERVERAFDDVTWTAACFAPSPSDRARVQSSVSNRT